MVDPCLKMMVNIYFYLHHSEACFTSKIYLYTFFQACFGKAVNHRNFYYLVLKISPLTILNTWQCIKNVVVCINVQNFDKQRKYLRDHRYRVMDLLFYDRFKPEITLLSGNAN